MFKNLFKSKKGDNSLTIYAPVDGEVVQLEDVPDPVFSEKMMGDGIAVKPANGKLVSPVKGEVIQVFPTKHAIGIRAENSAEVLLHIGLETVQLKGDGFTSYVNEGDKVDVGDKLIDFDINIIEEKASSSITPVLITNTNEMSEIKKGTTGEVRSGEDSVLFVQK
ncbi:PTS sugar transporter subunit IIA [Virgibacillus ainsalahensis]